MSVSQKRRRLLLSSLGLLTTGALAGGWRVYQNEADKAKPAFLGCAKASDGSFAVTAVNTNGEVCFQTSLPGRGHGIAINQNRSFAYVFARRPGQFIESVDLETGAVLHTTSPPAGKFFYGHGDVLGNQLFVVEGDIATSEGSIGVYHTHRDGSLTRIREISGFGIGPHEMKVINGTTLAVAVGGIRTEGRKKLNLDSMQPSLVLMDIESGQVKEKHTLEDPKLSIRHLALSPKGDVVIAQQYQGDAENIVPLLAIKQHRRDITPLKASREQWTRFQQYIGSVACTESQIVATSPRGNCFGIWDLASGVLTEMGSLFDASGAAAVKDRFALSAGSGRLVIRNHQKSIAFQSSSVVWDNHWVML
ncbi:hypothetical protein RN22_16570 [Grimontia sp. AD028]|uniref:DUF1513 domain-containing protein n=1 Tax=Grimontia sp. AD028 TaxID=1581149 RepID=UPI00061B51D0|nr:DUF1513 domain-containing protein [Grimontia sp. AD028]KKD59351.1 hypothetical protein RN22_16570 [Grimontia sp. AD028]